MKLRRRSKTGETPAGAPETQDELEIQTVNTPTAQSSLTRNGLIAALAGQSIGGNPPLTRREVEGIVTVIEETIAHALASGQSVNLTGFLKLEPVTRKARTGRNPQNGQPVQIAEKRVVRVKVLKQLADQVAASA